MQKKIPHFLLQAARRRPFGWLPLRTRIHFKITFTLLPFKLQQLHR